MLEHNAVLVLYASIKVLSLYMLSGFVVLFSIVVYAVKK